jgi:hypothetical protein
MPIGSGIVYNTGDLILSQVSSSGTAFLETKIAAATSSLIYFDSTARINSASLNSITVGTASYVSGSTSIITNLTASNISASGTSSFGYVGIGTNTPGALLEISSSTAASLLNVKGAGGNGILFVSGSGNVGVGTPIPTARLDVRPATPIAAYQGTVPYQTTTAAILSPVMAAASTDTYTSILQLVSVRQALVAGRYAHGYLGFSTVDNSNISGILDAGRISIKNDEGIGLYSPTAMGFWTNPGGSASTAAIERVRIASDGNVGIGTTNPSSRLHISGSSSTTITITDDALYTNSISNDNSVMTYTVDTGNAAAASADHVFKRYTTELVRINASGNVGIGTTSPVSKLHVYSGNGTAQIFNQLQLTNMGTPNTGDIVGIGFAAGESTQYGVKGSIGFIRTDTFGRGAITFYTNNTAGTETVSTSNERMRIDASGGINIGTPSQLNSSRVSIADSAVKTSAGNCLTFATATGGSNDFQLIISRGSNTNGYYALQSVEQGVSYKNIVFNQDGGNVGIGTTAPAYKLTVQNDAASTNALLGLQNFSTSATTNHGVSILPILSDNTGSTAITAGGLYWLKEQQWTNDTTSRDSYLRIDTTENGLASEKVRITSAGNVGIGTTAPAYKLDVVGDIHASSEMYLDNGYYLRFKRSSGGVSIQTLGIPSGTDDVQLLTSGDFNILNGSLTNLMTVKNGGSVGIGITSPTVRLHVSGSSIITNPNPGANSAVLLVQDEGTATTVKDGTTLRVVNNGSAANFSVFEASSAASNFVILNNGNVGIGTISPDSKLHISQTGTVGQFDNIALFRGGPDSNDSGAEVFIGQSGNSRGLMIRAGRGTSDQVLAHFYLNKSGGTIPSTTDHIMTFLQGGNVGIGTVSPAYLLDVSGSSRFGYRTADTHQFTGSVSVSGSLNATASWANNVVSASYALTSSFATRAQTANALNALNTYSIAGLTSAYVDVDGSSAPTTGIYRPSTKTLGLSADSTLIFKISNVSATATSSIETGNFVVQSGNVGLGTNSPNNKLDIWGATSTTFNMANVDDSGRGGKLTFISSSATGRQFYVGTNSSVYNLVFGIDSVEKARIDTNGNLGIGTTSPVAKLQVSGSISGSSFTSSVSNAVGFLGTASWAQNVVSASFATTAQTANALNSANSYTITNLTASGAIKAGSAIININGNLNTITGNVTTMGYNLTGSPGNTTEWVTVYTSQNALSSNDIVSQLAYDNYVNEKLYTRYSSNYGASWSLWKTIINSDALTGSTNYIPKFTGANAIGNSSIYDSSGNIGIGTTSLVGKLDVYDNTDGPLLSFVRNASSGLSAYSAFVLRRDGGNNGIVLFTNSSTRTDDGGAGNSTIRTDNGNLLLGAGGSQHILTTAGNVGIGTTSPNDKLHVSGSITAGTNTSTFGTTILQGYYTAGSLTVLGTEQSSGGPVLGYAVTPSTSSTAAFLSSTTITIPRSAYTQDGGTHRWYLGTSQTAAIGSAVTLSEVMRINSSGYVGIGTTTPGSILETYAIPSTTSSLLKVLTINTDYASATGTGFGGAIVFKGRTPGNVLQDNAQISAYNEDIGDNGYALGFYTRPTVAGGLQQRMTILRGGNVGIGTTNPRNQLTVIGAAQNTSAISDSGVTGGTIFIGSSTNNFNNGGTLLFSTINDLGTYLPQWGIKSLFTNGQGNGVSDLAFSARTTGSATALTEIVRFRSDGYVGIGTSSPAFQTEIFGTNQTTANITDAGNKGGMLVVRDAGSAGNNGGVIGFSTAIASGSYIQAAIKSLLQDGNGYGRSHLAFSLRSAIGDTSLTERVRILNDGNIGIGTTSPAYLLDVSGSSRHGYRSADNHYFTGSVNISGSLNATASWANNVVSASYATTAQTANALNTGNSYTIAGLTNNGTLSQQGTLSMGSGYQILATTGTTSNPGIAFVGDTNTGIYSSGADTIGLVTGGSEKVTINSTGNVGIGTNNPAFKLDVSGSGVNARIGNAEIGQWPASTAYTYFGHEALDHSVGGNYAMVQSSAGETFINSAAGQVMHFSVGNSEKVQISSAGNVGINTQGSVINAKLTISGSGSDALLHIKSPISGAILYVSGSGAVGIGTSNVGAFTLQVSGSFGATTKSFIIDHPTKAGKKLMYGSLESPYHGIRLTGRDTLVNGKCKIQLPDYIYKLILHDSVNIQLTGIKCNKTLYVDEINIPENYFTIAYDKAIFESYKDYDFFWDFTAIRSDVPELITEL